MSVVTFSATGMIGEEASYTFVDADGEYVLLKESASDKIILLILLFSSIFALSSVAYMHEKCIIIKVNISYALIAITAKTAKMLNCFTLFFAGCFESPICEVSTYICIMMKMKACFFLMGVFLNLRWFF